MTLQLPSSGEHQNHVDILGPLYNHQEDDIEYTEDLRPRFAASEVFDAARAMQRELRGVTLTAEQALTLRIGLKEDIAVLDKGAEESGCYDQMVIIRGEGIIMPSFTINALTGYFKSSSTEKSEQEQALYDIHLDSKYAVGAFKGFTLHFKQLQDPAIASNGEQTALLDAGESNEDLQVYIPTLVYRLEVAQLKDVSVFVDASLYAIGEVDAVSIEFDKDKRLDEMPPGLEELFSVKNRRFQESVARLYDLLIDEVASPLEIAKRASAVVNQYKDPHDARIQDKVVDLIRYCKRDNLYNFHFSQYSQVDPHDAEDPITYCRPLNNEDSTVLHSLDNLIFRPKFTLMDGAVYVDARKVELNIALIDSDAEGESPVIYIPLDRIQQYETVDD